MDVKIRKAQMGDASSVAFILRELGWWEQIKAEQLEETVERVMGHIRLCNADHSHSIYVAENQDGIIGYAAVHWLPYLFLSGPEGYVSELFILEKARGKGIGTQLLEAVKQEAKERGCSRLMLINNRTRESYKRKFYPKLGWEESKKFTTFILGLRQAKSAGTKK